VSITRDDADVTRDETGNGFDLTRDGFFDDVSQRVSKVTKRAGDARRARAYRQRKKLGLYARTIRTNPKQVTKLIELGYLDLVSRGDARAEAFAIEAYLRDSIG
jgi:hypothetical protein